MSEKVKPLDEKHSQQQNGDILGELKRLSAQVQRLEQGLQWMQTNAAGDSHGRNSVALHAGSRIESRNRKAQEEVVSSFAVSAPRDIYNSFRKQPGKQGERSKTFIRPNHNRYSVASLGPASRAISEWKSYEGQCSLVVYVCD